MPDTMDAVVLDSRAIPMIVAGDRVAGWADSLVADSLAVDMMADMAVGQAVGTDLAAAPDTVAVEES